MIVALLTLTPEWSLSLFKASFGSKAQLCPRAGQEKGGRTLHTIFLRKVARRPSVVRPPDR